MLNTRGRHTVLGFDSDPLTVDPECLCSSRPDVLESDQEQFSRVEAFRAGLEFSYTRRNFVTVHATYLRSFRDSAPACCDLNLIFL